MIPIRLNLAALRHSLSRPESLPDASDPNSPLGRLLSEHPVSRRTAIQVTGGAVVGFVPAMRHLYALGELALVGDRRRLAFVLDGRERWVIDTRRFAGSPTLRHAKRGEAVRIEMSGARFPGTALSADLVCEVRPSMIGHRMRLKLSLGGFRCDVPFEAWLRGKAAARSRMRLSQRVCPLGREATLVFAGQAEAVFSPDWTFTLNGRDLASVLGIGSQVTSDSVSVALAAEDAPSLFEDPPERRTVISLERAGRRWGLRPKLRLGKPGHLQFGDEAFDKLTIEAAQDRGRRVRRAWVATGDGGGESIGFEPSDALFDDAGRSVRLPLRDARYAVAVDRSGEQRAFLARYGEPVWISANGFNIEIGNTADAIPFEVVNRGGALERQCCEPQLLRVAVPLAGALVEPTEPPAGTRVALQPRATAEGAPPAAARFCFDARGRCTGLRFDAAPALAIVRPEDLLSVTFQFINLGLRIDGAGQATLVREPHEDVPGSLILVHFAPQNIAEQAFWERAVDADGDAVDYEQQVTEDEKLEEGDPSYEENPNSTSEEPNAGDIPVNARIAGRSRLAFRLPAEIDELPYTLASLLDWARLEPSIVAAALPPPPPPPYLIRPQPVRPGEPLAIQPRGIVAELRPLRAEVRVDAELQRLTARQLSRTLGRLPQERLQAVAATVTQTRPGYSALEPEDVSAIIAQLVRRPYEPLDHQTYLETPWRLILSPNRFAAWAHSVQDVTDPDTGITELWHTRLGVRRAGEPAEGVSVVDEEEEYYRTLRAVWSPDYKRDADQDDPPHYGVDSHPGNPFRMSVDARDRHELVTLTSDFLLSGAEDRVVRAERLMLSALGAWMNVRGAWELSVLSPEDLNKLSVEEWRHRATMARDHFVRVVYRGYLFPFGHRASLIKITERKFKDTRAGQVAFLRQRMYVIVRQPEKSFPAEFQPHEGRKFPFRRVRLATLATPSLDDPLASQIAGKGQGAFWMKVANQDFQFSVVAEDVEGQTVEFTTPLAFIDSKFAVDIDVADQAIANFPGATDRNVRPLDGQKLAYAPSAVPGDTTFETDRLRFGAETVRVEEVSAAALRAQDQPRFYPAIDEAAVELPAVKQLAGAAGAVPISYPEIYLERGFAGEAGEASGNAGQVFAALTDPVDLTFGGGSAGTDNVGALVTPNLSIEGLSRLSGPVSDIGEMMKGVFDPSTFFGALDAKILGGVSLLDIVQALTGFSAQLDDLKEQMDSLLSDITEPVTTALLESLPKCEVPSFVTQFIYDDGEAVSDLDQVTRLPKQVQLTFKWDPKVSSFGPFVVDGDAADTLTITALGLMPISLDGTPKDPKYTVSAKLKDFTLDLFNIIAIQVESVRFTKEAGKKPDVKANVREVEFLGPLSFVEELQNVIPSNGFADAGIDVTPTGIKAGFDLALPTIGTGVFTLDNVSLGGQLGVPFTGEPLRFRFNFCTREQPFVLTVFALGGGGYFGIEMGLDGVELLEAALEFGAAIAVDFGVASGGVSVKAGIYFAMEGSDATLTGYFRMAGHVDVLGLITASIVLYLALTYQSSPEMVWGEATLTIEIEILFFSASVNLKARKEFTTPSAPTFADLMNEDEWVTYQLAFAA